MQQPTNNNVEIYGEYLTRFEHKMAHFANLAYYMDNINDCNDSCKDRLDKQLLIYKQKTNDANDYDIIIANDNTGIIKNNTIKEVYLIVTGTRDSLKQYSKIHIIEDCCDDIDIFIWQNASPRMHKLSELVEHYLFDYMNQGYTVYATGHSLGGFIVDRLAEKYLWLICYSFNAPGVAHHMINETKHKIIELDNLNTYRIDSDFISNRIGTIHYQGKVNEIFHYVDHNISAHSILNFTDVVPVR